MTETQPTILIIDDEFRVQLYEMWLADEYSVRKASSREAALSNIDETVGVVFLRHELLTELKEEIEAALTASSPAGRIAVTTSERSEILFPDISCATTICPPITEAKITTAAETLGDRALYHEGLRQYYGLSVQATNCELTDSDEAKERSKTLKPRLEGLAARLRTLRSRLDAEDRQTVRESFKPEIVLPDRSADSDGKTTKYRPDACRECNLPWGVNHGGDLGEGYRSLGAYTWKCERCRTVQNIPAPNNRGVARRRFSP